MLRILASIALALAMVVPAAAQSPYKWTGCYVGVQGGYSMVATQADLDVTGFPLNASIDGLSADNAVFGGAVGCDMRLGDSGLLVGVFGSYSMGDRDHNMGVSIGGNSLASAGLSLGDSWTVGGRVGYLVTPSTLVYGLAGWTQTETGDLVVTLGNNKASFDVSDLSGWTVGGGLEVQLGYGWSLAGEYRANFYDEETIKLVPGLLDLNLKTTEHVGMVRLAYKLGFE